MNGKRIVTLMAVLAASVSLAFGQDLVEAARKEKERRDNQKNKKVVVITNSHLTDVKKKPSVPALEPEASLKPDAGGEPDQPATKTPASFQRASTLPVAGPEPQSAAAGNRDDQKAELQGKYDRAKERVELLTLKMLSLRQQLTTFNSMQTKDKVQQDVGETYQKLLEAQTEAKQAKEALGAATIKETVRAGLEAVVRRRKLQALADAFGAVSFDISPEDLRMQRRKRSPHVPR